MGERLGDRNVDNTTLWYMPALEAVLVYVDKAKGSKEAAEGIVKVLPKKVSHGHVRENKWALY
jgi:hypothetical protein